MESPLPPKTYSEVGWGKRLLQAEPGSEKLPPHNIWKFSLTAAPSTDFVVRVGLGRRERQLA